MTGYLRCRSCGAETNCADLVSGLCPACARVHVAALAELQRQYDAALAAGDPGASERVSKLIGDYERSERIRLKDASHDRHLDRVVR